jgi:hypothetical protein
VQALEIHMHQEPFSGVFLNDAESGARNAPGNAHRRG